MEEFSRNAMKQLGDSVVTEIQWIQTDSNTYISTSPDVVGEFMVQINIANASEISFQFLNQDSGQRHIVTCAYLPEREDFVTFHSDVFLNEEVRRTMMSQVLDDMIMPPTLRRQITDLALHTAHAFIVSRPPKHNIISIKICVHASFKFDWDEVPVLDDKDELCKEVKRYTVPAIDAETCAVCLKDFFGGSSKHVFTPCGHKFHVDCINGWLRVNCSSRCLPCPVCRHSFDRFAVTTS